LILYNSHKVILVCIGWQIRFGNSLGVCYIIIQWILWVIILYLTVCSVFSCFVEIWLEEAIRKRKL